MELYESIATCIQAESCTECHAREGCKIRKDFYRGDTAFEVVLQMIEIKSAKRFQLKEETALKMAEKLREKRETELSINPVYSYD